MVKELRLGNLILMNGEQTHVYQIEHRFKETYRINDIIIDSRIIGDRFEGIELTPDWLAKVDWGGYKDLYFNSYFCLDSHGHLYYHGDYTGINVKYLHQLQNLFWCLTGSELELTK